MNTNTNNKIAIFGGTFNPPTKAHEDTIIRLSKIFKEVWVLPVFNAPHKTNVIAFHHRVAMLKLITENLGNVLVSEYEKEFSIEQFQIKEDITNYTYKTMQTLSQLYNEEFVYVSGPDVNISSYKNSKDIGEHYVISDNNLNRSSEFRNSLLNKDYQNAKTMIPCEVWNYITQYKLFDPNVSVKPSVLNKGYFSLIELDIAYNEGEEGYSTSESYQQHYKRLLIKPKNAIGITLFDLNNNKALIKREKRLGPFLQENKLFSYGVIEGTIEEGEDPRECAKREVLEEAGIHLKDDNIILVNSWYPSAGYMTEKKHVLIGFFNSDDYKANKHGLAAENEEIYTELFDIDELEVLQIVPNSNVFSPEIVTALFYLKMRC